MNIQSTINASLCFVLLAWASTSAPAADHAIIKNKALDAQRKEVDTAVYVTKVNDLGMEEGQAEIEVSAGERTLDIYCIVRTFVGMGTVDIGKSTRMIVKLDAERTYRLDAKLTAEGDCTPTLQ